jgi:putative FmdB family regulatory protein
LPTYEYLCSACDRRYDKREGFDAKPRQKCQFCGKQANRVLHAPPVVFKGSGFYKTDNRGSSSATDASAPAVPAPSADEHGHSHGPGGQQHDTPAPDTAATESAAAG